MEEALQLFIILLMIAIIVCCVANYKQLGVVVKDSYTILKNWKSR